MPSSAPYNALPTIGHDYTSTSSILSPLSIHLNSNQKQKQKRNHGPSTSFILSFTPQC